MPAVIPKWARSEAVSRRKSIVKVDEERKISRVVKRQRMVVTKTTAAIILEGIDEERLWHSFLKSENEGVALEAAKYLTDRRDGKPRQTMDVDNPHLRSLAERLAAARDGRTMGDTTSAKQLSAPPVRAEDFLSSSAMSDLDRDRNANEKEVLEGEFVENENEDVDLSLPVE